MKHLFATALLAGFICLNASAQGIDFFHGSWADAQAKAKSEQKLIFVDAFASWCGPCKRMAAQVFPDPKVGEFFNPSFICLKIDMEKPENAEFAGKYPVSAYPTLMILDADGKIVQKSVGALQADGLIAFGQKAIGKADNSVDYEKEYAAGKREPQFMLDYVRALNRANKPTLKITNEYLNSQKDLSTPINLKFILEGAVEADSRVFDLLLQHRDKIAAQEGAEAVKTRIALACKNTVKKAVEFKSEELLNDAKAKMKAGLPDRASEFAYESDMNFYAATQDSKRYLKTVQNYQKTEIKNNAAKLYDLVNKLLRTFPDDTKVLDQAEKWAKIAAENGGLPEYYLVLADVYKRQGNTAKARATAEKALQAADSNPNGMKERIEYFMRSLG
ncbi:MAG: thioredoxin family protein [Saprospiraceae bacterium]|nr:thioredoxin family protein [Saprospiraceae bacterium]